MNKPIINGIDVSECCYFNSVTYEEPYCNIDQEHLYTCRSDENCYFKQLKRLQKENEVIKKEYEKIQKVILADIPFKEVMLSGITPSNVLNTIKEQSKKYKQALEEIKTAIKEYESKEWNCFNDMDAKLEKISEILDEVLND